MRPTLRPGMTLTVIWLLFLAFNLVWVGKLPDIRWDFSQEKTHTLSPQVRQLLSTTNTAEKESHPCDLLCAPV